MCYWKMKSATESSYTGTEFVYTSTSAIAALKKKMFFLNICVYMILGKYLEREISVFRRYIVHVITYF
jgi:hypothetical protein